MKLQLTVDYDVCDPALVETLIGYLYDLAERGVREGLFTGDLEDAYLMGYQVDIVEENQS